jgi:hypothetical protein
MFPANLLPMSTKIEDCLLSWTLRTDPDLGNAVQLGCYMKLGQAKNIPN